MKENILNILSLLPYLIPLFLLELALLVIALLDLIKRKHVTGGNKWIWGVLIVLVQVIGPAIYLIVGRKEDNGDDVGGN